MATAEGDRNQGIGSRLLQFAIDELERDDESLPICCNSRLGSARFYKRFGFVEVSKPFVYGNAGPSISLLRG